MKPSLELCEKFNIEADENIRNLIDFLESNKYQSIAAEKLISNGCTKTSCKVKDMRLLEELIIKKFKSKKSGYDVLTTLVKWVDLGNYYNCWDICPPRTPVFTKGPVSPYSESARKLTREYKLFSDNLIMTVKNKDILTPNSELGRLFMSSILYGGLNEGSLLKGFAEKIDKPINCADSYIWIDLNLIWRKQSDAELRKWFLDPLTEVLFYSLSKEALDVVRDINNKGWTTKNIWCLIKCFLKLMTVEKDRKIKNLKELINISNFNMLIKTPAFVAAYSSKKFVNHSLKLHVWNRLLGKEVINIEVKEEVIKQGNVIIEEEVVIESPWFTDAQKAIREEDKSKAINNIEKIIKKNVSERKNCSSVIPEWLLFMLVNGSVSKNKLALSTIIGYMSTTGRRLASILGVDDITTLGVQGLSEVYEIVLEDALSTHHRRNIARGIREFHYFLEKKYHIESINSVELLGIGLTRAPVDANIISIDEFKACIKEIRTYPILLKYDIDLAEIAALITTIAFKCGTRRMEVLRLRISDFHQSSKPEILIRPWDTRRLKTKSSTRKIPVYALLDEDELAILKSWWEKRNKQEKEEPFSEQLFAIPRIGLSTINQEFLFPKIHHILRVVTGDSTMRFHHLRHSFASWTALRLFLSDLDKIPDLFPKLPETKKWLFESKAFRKLLYGHDEMTRKHLYAIASILGHSAPDMSLEHYMHFSDLIRYIFQHDNEVIGNSSLLISASNEPRRTLYNKVDVLSFLRQRADKKGRARYILDNNKYEYKFDSDVNEGNEIGTFKNLWGFLTVYVNRDDLSFDELSQRFGYSEVLANNYIERAEYISNMKIDTSTKYRHNVKEHNLNNNKTRGLVADWIRNKLDKDAMQIYSIPLLKFTLKPDYKLYDDVTYDSLIEYYVEHVWGTKNILVFKSFEDAKYSIAYIKLLENIGVESEAIEYRMFSDNNKADKYWRKRLGVKGRIKNISPPNKKSSRLDNSIAIKVLQKGQYIEDSASKAIQLLLYLSAVMIRGRHLKCKV